jgi:integrase
MLRWAVKRGDLDHDPMAGMEMPSPVRFRDRALSEPEIAQLWNTLAILPARFPRGGLSCERILRLCLITGQRVGEVAGMNRAELDLPTREWRLPAARSKNKHSHVIPLSGMALGIIKQALADTNGAALFAVSSNDVARFVAALQNAIGLAKWTPHDLRRSALTGMARLGIEPIVLGHVANHRGTTKGNVTLGVYIKHSYEAEKRRALDLWADRLAAIVSGKATAEVVPLGGRSR